MQGDNQTTPSPDQPQGDWQYTPDQNNPNQADGPALDPEVEFSWTASEFVANHKDTTWYVIYIVIVLALTVGAYFLLHDIISIVAVVVAGAIFGRAVGRTPKPVNYSLTSIGIIADNKGYPYGAFKSFSIVREGAFSRLQFNPLKRLGIPVGMYYEPADEDAILEVLSRHLPMGQEQEAGIFEAISHRLRF